MTKRRPAGWIYAAGIALLAAAAGLAAGDGQPPPAGNEIQRLVALAMESNRQLKALRHRIGAAQERVQQAGALPDPMATLALSNMPVGSFSLDRTPMSGIALMLRQKWPYPGKLKLRELVARQDVAITEAMYQEAAREVARQVKRTYFDLYYVARAEEITQRNKDLAGLLAELAAVRYSVGKGLQQDVARAQLEVSRYVDALVALAEKREKLRARLNALLDRPPDAPVKLGLNVEFRPVKLSEEAMREVALTDRPLLKQARAQLKRARIAARLADMEARRPDFTLGFDYRIRANSSMDAVSGDDFWSFSVGVTLPWFNKRLHRAQIAEAAEREKAAREMYGLARTQVYEAIRKAMEAMKKAAEQVDLYRQAIVPQAELALKSARAAYETGRIDILGVIEAQERVYKAQLGLERAIADYGKAVADLEYAVGTALQ